MRKRFLLSIVAALMFNVSVFAQIPETITIGTGTSTGYYTPFSCYYKNSWIQMIYGLDEVGYVGTIRGMS